MKNDTGKANHDDSPLMVRGGYEKLRAYKVAEAVYDATPQRFLLSQVNVHYTRNEFLNRCSDRLPDREAVSRPQYPQCGGEMRQRTAGKGPNAGKPFWGCSGYPDCRGTLEWESGHED